MGVRKRGNGWEAWCKKPSGEQVVIGRYDCHRCAEQASYVGCEIANTCSFGIALSPEIADHAQRLGIDEILEESLGISLNHDEIWEAYEGESKRHLAWHVQQAIQEQAKRLSKKGEHTRADWLLKATPAATINYPAVPILSVPITENGDGLPAASGVYFVWSGSSVAYVGQSVKICNRAKSGHERIFPDERISWLEFPCALLNYAEAYYIGICLPPRNFGKFQTKHENRELAPAPTEDAHD